MKKFNYDGTEVKIVKDLLLKGKEKEEFPLKDKEGTWVQIEYLTGPKKGDRVPAVKEKLG